MMGRWFFVISAAFFSKAGTVYTDLLCRRIISTGVRPTGWLLFCGGAHASNEETATCGASHLTTWFRSAPGFAVGRRLLLSWQPLRWCLSAG